MSKVMTERQGELAVLTLNNGVTNAIGPELVNDLSIAIDEIRDDARGMLLCGGEKFFSMGFDLPALITMKRHELTNFIHDFHDLVLALYTIPLPSASVLAGHAVAGGNILAISCDYRFATSELRKTGVNEIKLGLPVPSLADMVLRQIVGDRTATEMLYTGNFISFADAAEKGMIDAIFPPETLKQSAAERIARIAAMDRKPFAAIKANRVEAIKNSYEQTGRAKDEIFIDCWFSESTRNTLIEAAKKF
jgi:enoyl-CoA hydratase/carnithine racemase